MEPAQLTQIAGAICVDAGAGREVDAVLEHSGSGVEVAAPLEDLTESKLGEHGGALVADRPKADHCLFEHPGRLSQVAGREADQCVERSGVGQAPLMSRGVIARSRFHGELSAPCELGRSGSERKGAQERRLAAYERIGAATRASSTASAAWRRAVGSPRPSIPHHAFAANHQLHRYFIGVWRGL